MSYKQILSYDGNVFYISHDPTYTKDTTIQNTSGIRMIACSKCDIHYCDAKEFYHDGKLIQIPQHFTKCGCPS